MTGTKKWQMNDIIWVLDQYRAGLHPSTILAEYLRRWPQHSRQIKLSSIKYVWDRYHDDPEYNQAWEPQEISFILGLKAAQFTDKEIVSAVYRRYPDHSWPAHVPKLHAVNFVCTKYTHDQLYNRQWSPEEIYFILQRRAQGVEDGTIHQQFMTTWPDTNIPRHGIEHVYARYQHHSSYRDYSKNMQTGQVSGAGTTSSAPLQGHVPAERSTFQHQMKQQSQSLHTYPDTESLSSHRQQVPNCFSKATNHPEPFSPVEPSTPSIAQHLPDLSYSMLNDMDIDMWTSVDSGSTPQMLLDTDPEFALPSTGIVTAISTQSTPWSRVDNLGSSLSMSEFCFDFGLDDASEAAGSTLFVSEQGDAVDRMGTQGAGPSYSHPGGTWMGN